MNTLSFGGWFFMIAAWCSIIAWNAFCFYKVLQRSEHSLQDSARED